MGEIAFTYADIGKRLGDTFELEIKIGDAYHLGKVRVKTISDTGIGEIIHEFKKYRRLNARFINLDAIQEYDLKSILKRYGEKF